MATWDADAETAHPVDFRLVQNTFVTMFRRSELLDQTVEWLRENDYDVVQFDAASWGSSALMCSDFAAALNFPGYFGRNLNALNDCLGDVASGDYGWRRDATGLVLVLGSFETFAAVDRRTAQKLLDILAGAARSALLVGNRLICLLQSNDPGLAFEPVGATPVLWNAAEWPSAERGI